MGREKTKKILFSGGGTGGSVTPLLAMAESLKKEDSYEFLFVGTRTGVEKEMVKKAGIRYKSIQAGKWRRYFSFQNIIDLFKILIAFFESLALLTDERPNLIISAGSFVSVPLVWAGWLFNIPILIHQQDVRPGLANKLMAPCARTITTVFEKSVADYGKKAIWTGNPVEKRKEVKKEEAFKIFNLKENLPIVFIIGGGTGAAGINSLVYQSLPELAGICQIIHSVGKGKMDKSYKHENYYQAEFIPHDDVLKILPFVDLAVTRAGISTLTDISYFSVPAIIIPMPESHQGDNAKVFLEKEAAQVFSQKELDKEKFVSSIKNILEDENLKRKLKENMAKAIKRGANEKIVETIKDL